MHRAAETGCPSVAKMRSASASAGTEGCRPAIPPALASAWTTSRSRLGPKTCPTTDRLPATAAASMASTSTSVTPRSLPRDSNFTSPARKLLRTPPTDSRRHVQPCPGGHRRQGVQESVTSSFAPTMNSRPRWRTRNRYGPLPGQRLAHHPASPRSHANHTHGPAPQATALGHLRRGASPGSSLRPDRAPQAGKPSWTPTHHDRQGERPSPPSHDPPSLRSARVTPAQGPRRTLPVPTDPSASIPLPSSVRCTDIGPIGSAVIRHHEHAYLIIGSRACCGHPFRTDHSPSPDRDMLTTRSATVKQSTRRAVN